MVVDPILFRLQYTMDPPNNLGVGTLKSNNQYPIYTFLRKEFKKIIFWQIKFRRAYPFSISEASFRSSRIESDQEDQQNGKEIVFIKVKHFYSN